MKKVLCVPCAAGLRAEGKVVKALTGKSMKISCEVCGRRRFGLAYDVSGSVRAVRCEQVRRDNEQKKKG